MICPEFTKGERPPPSAAPALFDTAIKLIQILDSSPCHRCNYGLCIPKLQSAYLFKHSKKCGAESVSHQQSHTVQIQHLESYFRSPDLQPPRRHFYKPYCHPLPLLSSARGPASIICSLVSVLVFFLKY